MSSPNAPPTLPAKSVSPVKSVERKRKHDEPSVWPGVCSMRICAFSPNGSSSPSTIGSARVASAPIATRRTCASRSARRETRGDVGGRVAVVRVFVRDQDVAQQIRAFGDRAQDRRRIAGRIDQRRRAPVLEEEQVAVRRVRIVRMVADVGRASRRAAPSAAPRRRRVSRGRAAGASQARAPGRRSAPPRRPSTPRSRSRRAPLRCASAASSMRRPVFALRRMSPNSSSSTTAAFAPAACESLRRRGETGRRRSAGSNQSPWSKSSSSDRARRGSPRRSMPRARTSRRWFSPATNTAGS